MKIKYNNEYYKIADSEIPETYAGFIDILPEIVAPELLPPKYHLRFHDLENFPIKLSNQRTYKGLLEEKKKSQGEIIIFVMTEEQDESYRNINFAIESQASQISQMSQILCLPNLGFRSSSEVQPTTQDSYNFGATEKEEFNPDSVIIEEDIARAKSEHLEENCNERRSFTVGIKKNNMSQMDRQQCGMKIPLLEDVNFGTPESSALGEGLSDRLEKLEEKGLIEAEKKGVSKRGEKLHSEVNDRKESKFKDSERDDNLEVLEKKRKTSQNKSNNPNQTETQKVNQIKEPPKRMTQLQEKWKNDFLIQTGIRSEILQAMALLKSSPEMTIEKGKTLVKDLDEMFMIQGERIKNLKIRVIKPQKSQESLKDINQIQEKWKNDFLIQTGIGNDLLQATALLNSSSDVPTEKVQAFLKEIYERLTIQCEKIKNIKIRVIQPQK